MTLPRISVVMPSFNQAAYLRQSLDSVLDQHYPNLEFIVMDGGSTDGSADILRAYSSHLTYWVSEPDNGQAHALNKGFARSIGDVMTWLNSDDLLLPNTLHAVSTVFARFPQIEWLTGQRLLLRADGIQRFPLPMARVRPLIRRGWYHGRLLGFIQQEGTFWRRNLWEAAGGRVDERLHYAMDYDLWRRFAHHADLVTIDRALGAFRVHEGQKTAQLARYYEEVGIRFPQWARAFTIPLRLLVNSLMWYRAPRLSEQEGQWHYRR